MSAAAKPSVKVVCVIVDRKDEHKLTKIISDERAHLHFVTLAQGTAGDDLRMFLGLESRDKSFVCTLCTASRVRGFIDKLSRGLQLDRPGKGIAFTLPVTGINRQSLDIVRRERTTKEDRRMGDGERAGAGEFSMIISAVSEGHVEELMTAARKAGARGGTVIHARRVQLGDDTKFLGIAAQTEKDIVAILTKRAQKNAIMSAIAEVCGMHTESRGVIFSLPVEEIVGLGVGMDAGSEEDS